MISKSKYFGYFIGKSVRWVIYLEQFRQKTSSADDGPTCPPTFAQSGQFSQNIILLSQNKAIYPAKTNLLSQRKPLYAYDITFFCHPVPNLHRIRISAKRYQFILRKQNYSDNGNLFSFFIGHVDILGGIDKSKSGSFSFW